MGAPARFIGIDVSKARLDGFDRPDGTAWQQPNDPAGIAALVARLSQRPPTLVVLEATGAYVIPLVAALAAAGLLAAVINPRQARDFAKATGHLAKNDRLDAAVRPTSPRRSGPCRGRCPTPKSVTGSASDAAAAVAGDGDDGAEPPGQL